VIILRVCKTTQITPGEPYEDTFTNPFSNGPDQATLFPWWNSCVISFEYFSEAHVAKGDVKDAQSALPTAQRTLVIFSRLSVPLKTSVGLAVGSCCMSITRSSVPISPSVRQAFASSGQVHTVSMI
jgi:hypothetical protein